MDSPVYRHVLYTMKYCTEIVLRNPIFKSMSKPTQHGLNTISRTECWRQKGTKLSSYSVKSLTDHAIWSFQKIMIQIKLPITKIVLCNTK